jgi:hypothetical protein
LKLVPGNSLQDRDQRVQPGRVAVSGLQNGELLAAGLTRVVKNTGPNKGEAAEELQPDAIPRSVNEPLPPHFKGKGEAGK